MPIEKPARRLAPIKSGGIWDESSSPVQVSGTGLIACQNLTYRRYGSWSKRSGSAPAYLGPTGLRSNALISGFRWYRAFPTPLTQVAVAIASGLQVAGAPNLTPPYTPMTTIATFAHEVTQPVCFTSMRDPAESGVAGNPESDILIICGASLLGASYAEGVFTFHGTPVAGQTVSAFFSGGVADSSTAYTVLASDTLGSVAVAVSALINLSGAVTGLGGHSAYIAPTTAIVSAAGTVIIPVRASSGVATGNNITYYMSVTGAGLTVTPAAINHLAGAGQALFAPLKYDGTTVTGLSANIYQPFSGCVSWHNHLWFWGDRQNPDTVYASDIDNPESFSFMTTYGGYDIGVGDGDPQVQACVPIGNALYVFKRSSIYVITGYDFQSGEYQFSVQPVARGYGIPYRQCVAHLRNALVFWSGTGFYRLANGSFEPEYIGGPIPYTSQKVALGEQDLIRCEAGSYQIQTPYGAELRTNVALWAVDIGNGVADTVLVYDDDASANIAVGTLSQTYAWSLWTGWQVAAFIPFSGGAGPNTTQYDIGDTPSLYFIPFNIFNYYTINQVGGNATSDVFASNITGTSPVTIPVTFSLTTGWMDFGTPVLMKEMHQVFLDVEVAIGATAAQFTVMVTSKIGASTILLGSTPTTGPEFFEDLHARVNPSLRGKSFQVTIAESAVGTGYEINGLTYDFIEEALIT